MLTLQVLGSAALVIAVLWFMWRLPRRGESLFGWAPPMALFSPWLGLFAVAVTAFVIVYAIIFPAGLLYMLRLVRAGPAPPEDRERPLRPPGRPARPLSGADTLEPAR